MGDYNINLMNYENMILLDSYLMLSQVMAFFLS